MNMNPNFIFNNPNYTGIGYGDKDSIDTVTSLRVVEESEKIRQATNESLVDPLTDCYNRRFLDRFKKEHFDPNRDNNRVGFVVIDLNHLKIVNDTFGHAAGDTLLQYTATFLKANTRKSDVVIRLGGDEFVIICHNNENEDNFEDTMCGRMDTLLSINSPEGFAYGCAVFDKNRDGDFDDTQKLADSRMYAHKKNHRPKEIKSEPYQN